MTASPGAFCVHDAGEEGRLNNTQDNVVGGGYSSNLELDVCTFRGHLQLARLDDLHSVNRFVTAGGLDILNLVDNVPTFEQLAEDNVLAVEPPAAVSMNVQPH